MPLSKVAELFAEKIDRTIEEVIKVDDLDDAILIDEIKEYHPTPSIQKQLGEVLDAYFEVRSSHTDKVGIWISGFFGAGKSSFAKLLGVLLGSRKIGDQDAVDLFSRRVTDDRISVLLKQIREHIPTHVVIFDILKDNIAGAKEHPVTMVMYKALLRSLGYSQDIDLAELEINLEQAEQLDAFKARFVELYKGNQWDDRKHLVMTAFNQASATLHRLDPSTYPSQDSWVRSPRKTDISPRKLAERVLLLSKLRASGHHVLFVVDEIGQYTARELSRIGDLQGVIESFSLVGKGKIWLAATSQEKLEAILDIYEKDKTELARLQDRFAHKVFLNPSDIREVASHRVLSKSAEADVVLRKLYQDHSGRLRTSTEVKGEAALPGLTEDSFVNLYPLLPYQVDLLINVVSGLRRQSGGAQTMGGANRTIIKLAQQLLIHPKVGIKDEETGRLVTFDNVYDLIVTNISSEVQQEIDEISRQINHPLATPVAKALSLLQFAEGVYPTEANLAAVLHPHVNSPSLKSQVDEAVELLINARKIRRTEQGLKIQSAAERTWDEERDSTRPSAGDRTRIVKDALEQIWGKGAQAPSQQLGGWKRFSAGLRVGNEELVPGDVLFEVTLIDLGQDVAAQIEAARASTQADDHLFAWAISLAEDAERTVVEKYRSERIISRGARTSDEQELIRQENNRLKTFAKTLIDQLSKSLCTGRMFFHGNDRSPSAGASQPRKEAERVLGPALKDIYYRFDEGDVRITPQHIEAILMSVSLTGLPTVYGDLKLVQTIDGQSQLVTDQGAAREVMEWVRTQCGSGNAPSGKELEKHFKDAPYGWEFDLVRLLVATLLRHGKVTLTAQSQQIKSATTMEAKKELTNNPRFRALTIRLREEIIEPGKIRQAAKELSKRFGYESPELTPESVSATLRKHLCSKLGIMEGALQMIKDLGLPGEDALADGVSALRIIQGGDDEDAIKGFLESLEVLEKAIPRANRIDEIITEPVAHDLKKATIALRQVGPVLEHELGTDETAVKDLQNLKDQLGKESFYEHVPQISSATRDVIGHYLRILEPEHQRLIAVYSNALEQLKSTPGWAQISKEQQEDLAEKLQERAMSKMPEEPWQSAGTNLAMVREMINAAEGILSEALSRLSKLLSPEAVEISVRSLVSGPIASPDDLEAVIGSIRDAVEPVLASGKPVVLR